MKESKIALTRLERWLSPFTKVHAGEGLGVAYLFLNFFLLLFAYYLLKPVREALVLTEGSAEVRSYALAAQSMLLLLLIPLYGILFHKLDRFHLLRWVTLFFVVTLLMFCVLGFAHIKIGVVFFIWLGIFSISLVAQFWAFAVDIYSAEAGHRLFAFIAVGATLGALVGSEVAKVLFPMLGAYGLMLSGAAVLLSTVKITALVDRTVVPPARTLLGEGNRPDHIPLSLRGSFAIVLKDRYLLLIAMIVLILNCVNSTGEYILAKVVVERAEALVAMSTDGLTKGAAIGAIYGNFYFWVNLLTLITQLFLVHRIWQLIGVRGALLMSPLIAFVGYGLISFIPIFSIVQLVKILENSSDYSTQNVSRHALFLHVSRQKKYQGKTCIDTLFCRLGDLVQALIVYVGTNVFGSELSYFAIVNCILAAIWISVVFAIGKIHKRLEAEAHHHQQ